MVPVVSVFGAAKVIINVDVAGERERGIGDVAGGEVMVLNAQLCNVEVSVPNSFVERVRQGERGVRGWAHCFRCRERICEVVTTC